MALFNLGSINADHFYDLDHLPMPGETIAAHGYRVGLGGKGANISVAAARAGSSVCHIGSVGPEGRWMSDRLRDYGVDTQAVIIGQTVSGHAVICVDPEGENAITLFAGANQTLGEDHIQTSLSKARAGDILVMQNETNQQVFSAKLGTELGLKVAYVAAPFDAESVQKLAPYIDLLFLNEVEMEQLRHHINQPIETLGPDRVIVTQGSKGGYVMSAESRFEPQPFSTPKVIPVDTTGAGDTFTGFVLAGLDRGLGLDQAVALGARAAALKVTRRGTADAIPTMSEVEQFQT